VVLLMRFLAKGDQQETQNQCKAGLSAAGTRSQRDAGSCLSWGRTCVSHGTLLSLGTILPAVGQQALRRSCCTVGLRAQPLVLALTPRTVLSGPGFALCNLLWGARSTLSPNLCLE